MLVFQKASFLDLYMSYMGDILYLASAENFSRAQFARVEVLCVVVIKKFEKGLLRILKCFQEVSYGKLI